MTVQQLAVKIADAIQKMEGWFKGSRSYRNNNPGNIWDGTTSTKKKRIWPNIPIDKQGFLIYPDYETGRKALEKDITIKINRGMSLESLFYMYAPPNENNTENYIKFVMECAQLKDRKSKLLDVIKNA